MLHRIEFTRPAYFVPTDGPRAGQLGGALAVCYDDESKENTYELLFADDGRELISIESLRAVEIPPQDKYAEGRKAFIAGLTKSTNPYDPPGAPYISDAAYRWYAGWEDARYDAEAVSLTTENSR